jgi:hypothetical protein
VVVVQEVSGKMKALTGQNMEGMEDRDIRVLYPAPQWDMQVAEEGRQEIAVTPEALLLMAVELVDRIQMELPEQQIPAGAEGVAVEAQKLVPPVDQGS